MPSNDLRAHGAPRLNNVPTNSNDITMPASTANNNIDVLSCIFEIKMIFFSLDAS
jgi:hypothetical protein